MILSDDIKEKIKQEYKTFVKGQYAGKSLKERQKLGQFFTPPELTIKMLEKYNNLKGNILDPTCGAGGLLAAAVIAGANPYCVFGIELDPKILVIAKQRLKILGVPDDNIHLGNALNPDCYKFNYGYSYILPDEKNPLGKVAVVDSKSCRG